MHLPHVLYNCSGRLLKLFPRSNVGWDAYGCLRMQLSSSFRLAFPGHRTARHLGRSSCQSPRCHPPAFWSHCHETHKPKAGSPNATHGRIARPNDAMLEEQIIPAGSSPLPLSRSTTYLRTLLAHVTRHKPFAGLVANLVKVARHLLKRRHAAVHLFRSLQDLCLHGTEDLKLCTTTSTDLCLSTHVKAKTQAEDLEPLFRSSAISAALSPQQCQRWQAFHNPVKPRCLCMSLYVFVVLDCSWIPPQAWSINGPSHGRVTRPLRRKTLRYSSVTSLSFDLLQ